ncbi:MAG: ATP-dependent helicase [Verrucomicrobiia bacterium]
MIELGKLNSQQREAVLTVNRPLLILAGAGTGKTRVITYRIAYLITEGVPASNILAVTFTNKAAREMLERVNQFIPQSRATKGEKQKPLICTFHSLGSRILRQHIEKLGYKKNFVIYDEAEQLTVVKKILSEIATKNLKPDPKVVSSIISKIKNSGNVKSLYNDPMSDLVARRLLAKYESALRACNAVDFDDLLLLPLKLFNEFPEVLQHYRERFKYIMVDEYQDTNGAQFELIKLLSEKHRNLCVVGDDDQSIYGWRGAEISNILSFEKYFPDAKIVKLEQNYRSTNIILEAANKLISHNPKRHSKKLWSAKGTGEKIQIRSFETEDEEAEAIAEWLNYNNKILRLPLDHFAVLFRTNQQSRPIEMALRKAGISYHLVGGQSYFDRKEIRDAIAYLKVFVNPDDDVSLLRIANVPPRGLSDATMEKLLHISQRLNLSVFKTMHSKQALEELSGRPREAAIEFTNLISGLIKSLDKKPSSNNELEQLLCSFFEKTGYFDDLKKYDKDPENAANRVQNIKDMLAAIDNHEGETLVEKLENFLDEISLETDREDDKEKRPNSVTLITMHSCKGLEFPHVFIAGAEDNLIPHSRSITENRIDEERRLFYVAITRAMQSLTISYCLSRKSYGSYRPCHPSRFLEELPENLVQNEESSKELPIEKGKILFQRIRELLDESNA